MKNSDMKVIAIILSIALFFTIVTSNVVSIASVVYLAKGGKTVESADGGATNNDANVSTNNGGGTSTNNGGGTSATPETTQPSGGTSTTPDATQPSGDNAGSDNAGSDNSGASAETLSAEQALKMFQDAATDIKQNASASYNCKAWQVVEKINVGNSILESIITGFVTSEEKAETKVNAKGTDDSKNRMPASNCTMNAVQNITTEVSGDNYIITIVMKDQVNPTAEDTDGISLMSRDLLYMSAITNEVENNDAIKAIVKELKTAELNYKAFTIKATMTKDGKFVEITHECHAELKAEAALVLGSLSGDGVLVFHARFWDFAY